MNIVTGYRNEPHITSQQDRDFNLGIVGDSLTDAYVLNVGQLLEADIVSANEIRVRDGAVVLQGCLAVIDHGTYDSLSISNGSQGMLRTDIIAVQYERDSDTNVESMSLIVVEGDPDAADPQPPALVGGSIAGGDVLVQVPLYYVNLDGVSIDSITRQHIQLKSMNYLNDNTIVESGQSGMWNYRKWSDGTAECWGSKIQAASATSWGSLYYIRLEADDYPAALFTSVDVAFAQIASDIDYVSSARNQNKGGNTLSTTTPPFAFGIRPTSVSGSTNHRGMWYAKGKWK